MKYAEAQNLVDQISQSLVFGGQDQVEFLEDLPAAFDKLGAMVRQMGREPEAVACGQAMSLATKVLSGSVNWDQGAAVLCQTVNALQACLGDDCSAAEAGFPPELEQGLAEAGATGPGESPEKYGMTLVDDDILGEFLSRQVDLLQDVEKHLMGLEKGQEDDDLWLLRFYHTLKGESALLGLHEVSELCHAIEDMLHNNSIRNCVEKLLDANDWFLAQIRHFSHGTPAPAALKWILPKPESPLVADEAAPSTGKNILQGDVELLQDFIEEAIEHLDAAEGHLLAIESDPKDTAALDAVFRGFHTIKGLAGFIELDHIKELAHKAESLLDMARRGKLDLVGANMDAVFESVDVMKRLVNAVAKALGGNGELQEEKTLPALMGRLVDLTGEKAVAPEAEPEAEPVEQPRAAPPAADPCASIKTGGFIPLAKMKKKVAAIPAKEVVKPAETATPARATKAPQASVAVKEAVRVDSERLDRLIETLGELVIAETMVTQSPEIKGTQMSVKLAKDLDHLGKISRELQGIGMSLRMVPVRPVFQKMARLVRDLSKKTGRKVDLVMSGEDTELDKNVVDKIGDPLVHMVRNSVDHGIEPESKDRLKAGKPERGRVELRAFHRGGQICIEIQDDGRGLDREAILDKAVSRGLVREGENLSDREIFSMIFQAGFSTAKQVTEVSGRGVGMDVVRRNIEELRGTVEISSELGQGTTFSIRLPLTLAIIEGMVILVGQEHYIIPTLSVVRLIRPGPEDISHVFDRGEMLAFEGEHLPLFRLSGLFGVANAKTSVHEGTVVVVEDEGRKIGLLADELLGQQSIVIKSLGATVQGTEGVAGGAIMSDGNVALILDITGLVRVAHSMDTTGLAKAGRNQASEALERNLGAGATAATPQTEELEGVRAPQTRKEPVPTGA